MSERNNFWGGFLLGTLVGGTVGGIVGVLVSSRLANETDEEAFKLGEGKLGEGKGEGRKRRVLSQSTEESMEVARRGLEDKIAQLNEAIDDVRQQLGNVNGQSEGEGPEPSIRQES